MTEPIDLPAAPVEATAPRYDEAPEDEAPEDGDAEPALDAEETPAQTEPESPEPESAAAELQVEPEPGVNGQPPPPPEPAAPPPEPPTWESDENSTTFFLRALFTLGAGAFLVWSQMQSLVSPGDYWGQWVASSVVTNLLLPLGIVWMFYAQGLSHLDWLKDQRSNAWSYGWNFRDWRRHLRLSGIMFGAMLLIMVPFALLTPAGHAARDYYRTFYLPQVTDAPSFLWLMLTLTIYMLCWEWFHRGFLLFGMAQGFGPIPAIVLQAVIFAAAHMAKPGPEFVSSFFGGLVLGTVAWREKSFAPAFYTHALVHIAWVILVFVRIN